jgi:hypothetical protein
MLQKFTVKTFTSALVLSTVLISPALALDGKAFGDRLAALYVSQGGTLSFAAAEVNGTDVTLKGIAVDAGAGEPFQMGDATFTNVAEDAGTWTAETVTFTDVNSVIDDTTITMSGLTMADLVLPADPATPFILYSQATMKNMAVTTDGVQVFAMRDYVADVDVSEPVDRIAFTSAAQSMAFTAPEGGDAKSLAMMQALFGGKTVDGKLVMNGAWTSSTGRVELSELSYDVAGAGKINFAMGFDGYTTQFVKTLTEVTKTTAGADENAQAAQGLAMMGLMQQLAFVSTMIRYEDAGLASKALDQIAKEQGRPRDVIIAETKAIVPLGLAQLQKPEFAAAMTKAVSDFLDNPKSFTLKAVPAAPVPGAMLMATGMSAPQDLIEQLNVTVTAND